MQRNELRADVALSTTQDSDFTIAPAVIQAALHDGSRPTEIVEHKRGSPQHLPTRQDFETKVRQCARDVLLLAILSDIRRLLDTLNLAPSPAPLLEKIIDRHLPARYGWLCIR